MDQSIQINQLKKDVANLTKSVKNIAQSVVQIQSIFHPSLTNPIRPHFIDEKYTGKVDMTTPPPEWLELESPRMCAGCNRGNVSRH